jgi:subtilisin-like proprotein convertase family protein
MTHTFPDDLDILLVGPGGQAVMLMSDAGGSGDLIGESLTFDSSSFVTLPDAAQISGGVFRPVNYGTPDPFPAPAPAGSPAGIYGTDLAVFNGLVPNGPWRLYVVDDGVEDVGTLAGWVLTISTNSTTPPPDTTPDAFSFTDVTNVALSTLQTSNAVSITGIDTPAPVSVVGGEYSIGCGSAFTTNPGTITNGQTVCVRHVSAAANSATSNTTLTIGGVADTFTSTTVAPSGGPGTVTVAGGAVTILDHQAGAPYPSTVNVSNLGGTIAKVTVRLDGLTHTYPDDLDIALVGPGGQVVMLMSDAGGSGDINGVSLTFDASASATLPDSAQLSSGVFRPVNYGAVDPFPAPAPAGNYGTSLAVFNGLAANGTWRLYVVDDAGADVGTLAGWVLTITTQ